MLGFCPTLFLGVTLHVGKSGKNFGQKVNVNFFRVDPGRKKSKNVKKLLIFARRCFERLKQYLGGSAIFHTSSVCEGVKKNYQTSQMWHQFLKTLACGNISDAAV